MPRRPAVLVLVLLLWALPAWAQRDDARQQVEFGIEVAQKGLWKEAVYRWERATQLDPTYAQAFNNLAIGYEQLGQMDKAKAAYDRARALAPDNAYIRQNIELFKELNERTARSRPTP
jgi:Flp pilus assembly protein TadD